MPFRQPPRTSGVGTALGELEPLAVAGQRPLEVAELEVAGGAREQSTGGVARVVLQVGRGECLLRVSDHPLGRAVHVGLGEGEQELDAVGTRRAGGALLEDRRIVVGGERSWRAPGRTAGRVPPGRSTRQSPRTAAV